MAEAAERYQVSIRTLGQRVRLGEIEAHKVRGPWGSEWRIAASALEAFGYRLPAGKQSKPAADEHKSGDAPETGRLRTKVAALTRAVAVERNRAEAADRRLQEALAEIASLRARLPAQLQGRQDRVIHVRDEVSNESSVGRGKSRTSAPDLAEE